MKAKKTQATKKRVGGYFKKKQDTSKDLFNELTLFIYALDDSHSDLHQLAKILPDEQLFKLVSYFDGAVLKIPTKQAYKESLILSLVYYFYEVKKLSWVQIKEILGENSYAGYSSDFSFISLAKKVKKIRKVISKEMQKHLIETDVQTVITDVVNKA